jgi:tetratricopeptide (TPR) repeat protein
LARFVRLSGILVLMIGLFGPGVARAADKDDDDKSHVYNPEAKKKFAEGNERYARGDYEGAIESFKASIVIDPKLPGPYRNLGLAYRAQNRCADALPMYEKYLELKPESQFTDRVRREIDLCRAKLGQQPLPPRPGSTGTSGVAPHPTTAQSYLHVAANLIGGEATDEASVRVDGLVRGSTPLTIPVTAGKHRVHLERNGFESADATIEVLPGQRQEVELTMNKLPEVATPMITAASEEEEKNKGPKPSYKKYAWALLGVAGGFGLMGAGFGIAESQLHRDAIVADKTTSTRGEVDRLRTTGSNYAIGSYVGLSVGAAALVASAILFIIDPSRGHNRDKQKFVLSPSVGPQSGGVAAAVSF